MSEGASTRSTVTPERLSEHLTLIRDTCNVYVLRSGREAVVIDFGDGSVLDNLDTLGIDRITDVLMTHHHRDQAQGLPRAVDHGARIWVPPVERDLFAAVDEHWQARPLYNDYNNRQDRFSILEPVPIAGTLLEYRRTTFGGFTFEVRPTPGHTVGSVTILTEVDGRRAAFTGDLIAAPGKVWSLAATQWSYNGGEGIGASYLSLLDVRKQEPDVLLPSHGRPMDDPGPALSLVLERLRALHRFRHLHESPLYMRTIDPFDQITPHLLHNLTSNAYSYVLLSETGGALVIDYGYDFSTGLAGGADRASRRPWLYTVPALKELYEVRAIEVAIPTHYHDDHLAGFNLLRDVEGTAVWAGDNMADVLEDPADRDLPCLWYDPIPVDRRIPMGEPVQWHEYTITLHPLPGHTLYAVAIEFEVDHQRVLVVGDQLHDEGWLHYLFQRQIILDKEPVRSVPPPRELNYVYRNRFRIDDYALTAELYQRIRPDLMLFGHWPPAQVTEEYLDRLEARGAELAALHRALLPLDDLDLGAEGVAAWIHPYQIDARAGRPIPLEVEVLNPRHEEAEVSVSLTVPRDWEVEPRTRSGTVGPGASCVLGFVVTAPVGAIVRRARIAADVTAGISRLGQQAECLVSIAADHTA